MAQTGTSLQGDPLLIVARGTAQEICDPRRVWMCVLPKQMSCCSTPLSIGRVAATSFQASGIIVVCKSSQILAHKHTRGSIFDHASASTLLKSLLRFMASNTLSCRPGTRTKSAANCFMKNIAGWRANHFGALAKRANFFLSAGLRSTAA